MRHQADNEGTVVPSFVVAELAGALVDMDQHSPWAECRLDLIYLPAENARRFLSPPFTTQ